LITHYGHREPLKIPPETWYEKHSQDCIISTVSDHLGGDYEVSPANVRDSQKFEEIVIIGGEIAESSDAAKVGLRNKRTT
jgi:hypothetical protein